jgi:hypothetical protein
MIEPCHEKRGRDFPQSSSAEALKEGSKPWWALHGNEGMVRFLNNFSLDKLSSLYYDRDTLGNRLREIFEKGGIVTRYSGYRTERNY